MADQEQPTGVISQEDLEKLLGRPLTSTEVSNLSLYLDIAEELLTDLLCSEFVAGDEPEEQTFESRDGYRSLPIGLFTAITSVTVDDEAVDSADYTKMQNGSYNGSWYNILLFKSPMEAGKLYKVNATWGFTSETMPNDLQLLLARAFAMVSKAQTTDTRLTSKKIEDTSFTYRDVSLDQQFVTDNGPTIRKYSSCGWAEVRHGRVHRLSDC